MRRRTGAIFQVTVPETIMRSAWRGVARKSSMPKRAMSKREVPVAIISMAQQARPNWAGQRDDLRAQLKTRAAGAMKTFFQNSSSGIPHIHIKGLLIPPLWRGCKGCPLHSLHFHSRAFLFRQSGGGAGGCPPFPLYFHSRAFLFQA